MSERPRGGPLSWLERLSLTLLGEPKDREQLVLLLRDAQSRNVMGTDALAMIEGVLQIAEMQVRDIMVPRGQMVVIEHDATLEQILPLVAESAHSRFPVVGTNRDEVLGILLAKDLLAYCGSQAVKQFNMASLLRPAVFTPESKRLNILLKEFRYSRNHLALVVDEYGGVAGLVSIEDVLEQIVGEIVDEYDTEENHHIRKLNDNVCIVKAFTPIEEFNRYFMSQFSDEEFDTLGGLVMHQFGKLPRRGEAINIDRFRFKVLHADSRRIHLLQVSERHTSDTSPPPVAVG